MSDLRTEPPRFSTSACPGFASKTTSKQHQSRCPRLPVPVVVWPDRIGVNHHRQRRSGLPPTRTPETIAERSEKQRRSFAGYARKSQQHAGENAAASRRKNHASQSSAICLRPERWSLRACYRAPTQKFSVLRNRMGITMIPSAKPPASVEKWCTGMTTSE